MGKIYKLFNDINDKLYIGQTVKSLEDRFAGHLFDAERYSRGILKYNSRLYNAMNKYGYDKFHIELIEEVEDKFLNERERYYISYYNTQNNDFGYNICKGGFGGPSFLGKHHSDDTKKTLSEKLSGSFWCNNGDIELLVRTLPEGWTIGRLEGRGFGSGKDNPAYGKPGYNAGKHLSQTTKEKISKTKKINNKFKDKVWYNDGVKECLVDLNSTNPPDGWSVGRLHNHIYVRNFITILDTSTNVEYNFTSYKQVSDTLHLSRYKVISANTNKTLLCKKYKVKISNLE